MNLLKVDGRSSTKKLLASMFLMLVVAVLGAVFSLNASEIYTSLNLPSFAPPAWVFMPAWIILYGLMGLSFYRILMLDKNNPDVKSARSAFYIQLVFNVLWSILFFGMSLHIAAFIDILILLFYIVLTIVRFYKVDKTAAYLLIPYLLWVAFATVLNLAVVLLND